MKLPDYRILGPGHYSLLIDGRSYEVLVRSDKKGYWVEVDGHLIPVRSEQGGGEPKDKEETGPAVIESPMPGRVIGIKVAEGARIETGQGVIVVEAMKMENELVSPQAGIVKKIAVQLGQTVEAGQELMRIE